MKQNFCKSYRNYMTRLARSLLRITSFLVVSIAAIIVLALIYLWLFPVGQRPDNDYNVQVTSPDFLVHHPVVCFDEAHFNAHTSGNLFRPLAQLLKNDGYTIKRNTTAFTNESLKNVNLLVIANAAGGSNPNIGGVNLPWFRKGKRENPAFRSTEITVVKTWVQNGGSLLLVADHFPFGVAAAEMGAAFGVTMHGGFAEAAKQFPDQREPSTLRFTRENGLLADHPITQGRSITEQVNSVMLFTGQSMDAEGVVPLLALPDSAVEFVPPPPSFEGQPAGAGQGYAFEFGMGRVVILADAAMLTAQIGSDGERFGMNSDGNDNRQFVLNVMHWLSRLI